jgi:hypothetical protein
MSSGMPSTVPPVSPSKGVGPSLPPISAACLKAAAASTFTMPPGTQLGILSGPNWNTWSGIFLAFLQLNDIDDILMHETLLSGVDSDDWNSIQKKTKAFLCLYCAPDVHSIVDSETDFPSFKARFDRLRETYGSVGSTAIFNLWIELTQACLNYNSPLAPQLAKLNKARVQLSNSGMGVSDTQYCLILLNALPSSYEVVASTLLASGPASSLKHSEITARILNEEGRKSGPSSSLNTARTQAGNQDHSNITCHYCHKKGHIQRDCRKKKRDKKKQEEEDSSSESGEEGSDSEKAVNVLVCVPSDTAHVYL